MKDKKPKIEDEKPMRYFIVFYTFQSIVPGKKNGWCAIRSNGMFSLAEFQWQIEQQDKTVHLPIVTGWQELSQEDYEKASKHL